MSLDSLTLWLLTDVTKTPVTVSVPYNRVAAQVNYIVEHCSADGATCGQMFTDDGAEPSGVGYNVFVANC